jgi:molybdopterin synthase catalytic subunit
MTITIPKKATKEQVQAALAKMEKSLKKRKKKGNVSKFFGICKSEVDGLEFQKKVRSEWD